MIAVTPFLMKRGFSILQLLDSADSAAKKTGRPKKTKNFAILPALRHSAIVLLEFKKRAKVMNRITFWLLTAFSTFIIGATATTLIYMKFFDVSQTLPEISLPAVESNSPEPPFLSFCELVNNPEKYNGRIVRFSAVMQIGLENSSFSDVRCGGENTMVVSSKNEEVWKTIEKARAGKKNGRWAFILDLQVAGRFENIPFTQCCTKAPFQFEIKSVERASRVD
jgi:hypothetical protein